MQLKLFSDLIDGLGNVAGGLKAIVTVPKAERRTIRRTMDETYRLIDTTLNMVIIRLGDILLHPVDGDFLREAARLDNYNEWIQTEREFRLCRSLRVTPRETETLARKLAGAVNEKDWDALLQQMQNILATQGELALFIGQQLHQRANDARYFGQNAQLRQSIRDVLAAFRASLIAERLELIKQKLELYTIV